MKPQQRVFIFWLLKKEPVWLTNHKMLLFYLCNWATSFFFFLLRCRPLVACACNHCLCLPCPRCSRCAIAAAVFKDRVPARSLSLHLLRSCAPHPATPSSGASWNTVLAALAGRAFVSFVSSWAKGLVVVCLR